MPWCVFNDISVISVPGAAITLNPPLYLLEVKTACVNVGRYKEMQNSGQV